VVGKPLGVLLGGRLAALLWPGPVPIALTWPVRLVGAAACGIGFTVSLLVANLAFEGDRLDQAKVGVLAAAVVSALSAWLLVNVIRRLPADVRARQVARTSEDLVDLAEDTDPARDHVRGPVDAPVTLVEYGDYECPYCSVAEVAIREVLGEFGDDVRYVWRHLPLNDVHRSAQMAAEAAEAAAAQGAFWPMHDLMISDPDELDPGDLDQYAGQLGLDRNRFWDEIRRHVHVARIADDVASADASGVAGTPTFFINGRRHQGAYDVESLSRAIGSARRRALVASR
jgi:protein-disulfide isomerase